MAQALQKPIHFFDYLAQENASSLRHEYVGGRIHAMTGGSMRHNRIAFNIARWMDASLQGGPCQVFINDMKLHVQAADSVYYPDVFVYCGSATATDEKVVSDATLIVEVLSDSTATIDRREKLVAYQKLPSLQAYWIVSQDMQRVEVHSRPAVGHWEALAYSEGESIPVAWPGHTPCELAKIYAGTDLTV